MATDTESLEEQKNDQPAAETNEAVSGSSDAADQDAGVNGPDSADAAAAEAGSAGGDEPSTQAMPSEGDAQQVANVAADHTNYEPRSEEESLEQILELSIPVIVRLAEKRLPLKEILKFHMGTVLQFDSDAYEHVDLMVNNSTIGLGQPVKIGENFGLRIVQVGDISQTIRSLGGAGEAEQS